jgi:hypothetical protein
MSVSTVSQGVLALRDRWRASVVFLTANLCGVTCPNWFAGLSLHASESSQTLMMEVLP